jgi:CheY-like chemotaxis protein
LRLNARSFKGNSKNAPLESYRTDMVLLDIGMLGMDGYEVSRRIRQQPEFNDIRRIALSGRGEQVDRCRSRSRGFYHHLIKPADIGKLQALLSAS